MRYYIQLRHITLFSAPLDEWSVRRRDLCLITHNNHKRQTSVPTVGFENAIPASQWPQTARPLGSAIMHEQRSIMRTRYVWFSIGDFLNKLIILRQARNTWTFFTSEWMSDSPMERTRGSFRWTEFIKPTFLLPTHRLCQCNYSCCFVVWRI